MKQKKLFLCLFLIMLFSSIWGQAWGANEYRYELSADRTGSLQVGDEITLTMTLKQLGSNEPYKIYGAQNSLILNTEYFELVNGSEKHPAGWSYGVSNTNGGDILTFVFLDVTGKGKDTPSSLKIASFKVRLKAAGDDLSISTKNPVLTDKDAKKLSGVTAEGLIMNVASHIPGGGGGGDNPPGTGVIDVYKDGTFKKSYTLQELKAEGQHTVLYSTVNSYPTKGLSIAKGIKVETLLNKSSLLSHGETITFISEDGYKQTFTCNELFDDKRYYFPKLLENSSASKSEVPVLLALEYAGGTDASKLRDGEMRLCIGQRSITEQNNVWFVQNVSTIEIDTDPPGEWDEPEVDVEPGNVEPGTEVSFIYDNMDRVKIYYTTDGTTPSYNSTMYNVSRTSFQPELNLPVIINKDTTIKAMVIGAGRDDSKVAVFNYRVGGDIPLEDNMAKKKETSEVVLEVEGKIADREVRATVGIEELKVLINRGKEQWQDVEEQDILKVLSIIITGISEEDDIRKATLILPKEGMGELAKSNAHALSLDMFFLKADFGRKVFESAEKDAAGDFALEIIRLEEKDIPAPFQTIEDRGEVCQVDLYFGDDLQKDLGGNMEISFPYKLKAGGNAHEAVIYSLTGQNAYIYKSSRYYSDDGLISCVTTRTGIFTAGYHRVSFKDAAGHWAFNYITQLGSREVIQGYGDKSFKPNGLVTRAEFLAMLVKSIDNIDLIGANVEFDDVQESSWYYPVIGWAFDNKIVSGMGNNRFMPNSPITREQMVAMIENFGRVRGISWRENVPGIQFKDKASISSWAVSSIDTLTKAGIISGRPDSSFDPKGNASRGEAAKLVSLTLGEVNTY